MIFIDTADDDRFCNACGKRGEHGDLSYQRIKEIKFTVNGHSSSCVALCSKCRQDFINAISEEDGWGKLLEVK